MILNIRSSNHPRLPRCCTCNSGITDAGSAKAIVAKQSYAHPALGPKLRFPESKPPSQAMQITTQKRPDDLQLQQSVTSSTAIPVAPYNTTLRNQQYSFNPSNANSITSTEEQVFLFKMPDSIHLSTLEKPQTQDIKQLWLPSTSHKSLKIQQDNKLILTNKAVYFL